MKINLNNPLVIGTATPAGEKYKFTFWGKSENTGGFERIAQYLIDGIPDTKNFVVIDEKTQVVYKFDGIVDALKLKSKRYPRRDK